MFQEYTLTDTNEFVKNTTDVTIDIDSIELLMKVNQEFDRENIKKDLQKKIDSIEVRGSVKERQRLKDQIASLEAELADVDKRYANKSSYSMRTKSGEPYEISEEVYNKLKVLCQDRT